MNKAQTSFMETMRRDQERNLNWSLLAIPEGCDSIFVCADGQLFDEWIKAGMVPLLDTRNDPEKEKLPAFIGYSVTPSLKFVDTLLDPHAARPDEATPSDHHTRKDV